jgi:D-alanyl-D-alanine carboxypeptidase
MNMSVAVALAATGLIAIGASPAAAAPAATTGGSLPPAKTQAIDEVVEKVMASERVPGVNLAVRAPNTSYRRSYGVADLATGAPMARKYTVRMASISKTFTGIAVLRLVDQGRLRLSDKLADYVKGVDNGKQITIRQLLGMTGGIYDFTRDEQFNAAFSANPLYPGWKPRDVLPILERHQPDFRPGKIVSYSDSNYVLLGLIIEKITGKPVKRTINRLSRRAGLRHTASPTVARLRVPFAHGYYAGDMGDQPLADYTLVNPDVAWTAGNMTTTIGDLQRWAVELGTGKLISKRLFRAQRRFRPIANPGGPKVGYGLGLFRIDDWIGHNGAIYGFNTVMFYLPGKRASIVISANKSTNFSAETLDMFLPIAKSLYPNSVTG